MAIENGSKFVNFHQKKMCLAQTEGSEVEYCVCGNRLTELLLKVAIEPGDAVTCLVLQGHEGGDGVASHNAPSGRRTAGHQRSPLCACVGLK